MDNDLPILLLICDSPDWPIGVLYQTAPLYWIHLSHSSEKIIQPYFKLVAQLIRKGRTTYVMIFGREPYRIIVPYDSTQRAQLDQTCVPWILALIDYAGVIDNHVPKNKLIQFASRHQMLFPKITSMCLIPQARTVFTDGSSTGMAALVSEGHRIQVHTPYHSAQLVELSAILLALVRYTEPLNIYTDSQYVALAVPQLETVGYLKATGDLLLLFSSIQNAILNRINPFTINHIQGHSGLPGALSQGNYEADALTHALVHIPESSLAQARSQGIIERTHSTLKTYMF